MQYLDETELRWKYINYYTYFPHKMIYITFVTLVNILLTLECLLVVASMSSGSKMLHLNIYYKFFVATQVLFKIALIFTY